ncbi:MAG TPA: PEP-CTERM sorting domain-containing protein [Pyrinomonadaceae bacterium]|nr:PEP-CTERM sorting domain-containing protein [Pyrinomonadaceae bacterium]
MSKLLPILLLAAFLYIPASVNADPVVLTFDEPTRPSDLYQSQGVVLMTILIRNGSVDGAINDIVLRTSPAAVSPPQGLFPVNVNPQFAGVNGIDGRFVFTTSENVVVQGSTTSVQFNVIGSQGTWTVLFFDTTNPNQADIQTGLIGTFTGSTDQVINFSSANGIGRFVLIPSLVNSTTGIDNLQFEATSVPEPSTLLLLAFGVGGLVARKRRNWLRTR